MNVKTRSSFYMPCIFYSAMAPALLTIPVSIVRRPMFNSTMVLFEIENTPVQAPSSP